MVSVTLKNVSKRYGNVVAVEGIDLEIKDKEFLTILGPSGSGKTTLLRLITGLETPTEGEIYFGDRLVNDVSPKERNVSLVFQNYALFPHMSVYDNIAFPLTVRGVQQGEVKNRVTEVAQLLEIPHLLERRPRQLSGGEQQRVALGRALARKPDVFLMDEPLSSVDASLRIAMRTELKKLQKNLENTLIYVTHDQTEAMTMADRIAVMKSGKIVQVDSPGVIYDLPRDEWVASFIGSPPMNLIDGTILANGKIQIEGTQSSITLPSSYSSKSGKLSTGRRVKIGVRPEDIEVNPRAPDGVTGDIYLLESLGDSTIADIKLGNSIVRAREEPGFTAQIGEKVSLKFNERRLMLFDSQTGAAL